jgi:hypothetical protein
MGNVLRVRIAHDLQQGKVVESTLRLSACKDRT